MAENNYAGISAVRFNEITATDGAAIVHDINASNFRADACDHPKNVVDDFVGRNHNGDLDRHAHSLKFSGMAPAGYKPGRL